MAKQLTLGFEGGLVSDLARYPCADVRECFQHFPQGEFDFPEVDKGVIEVQKPGLAVSKPEIVVPRNWDLRKMDLTHFNQDTLENVFYGTWNLWVPTEILDLENPVEIVANYFAAGILKRYNGHRVNNNNNIPKGSFSKLVGYLNQVAYSNPVFRANLRHFKKRFSTNPGEQMERLAGLSGEVKRQFCASFYKPYRASKREEPNNPDAFYDPGFRQGYINRIYSHFQRRFEKEHPKK